jgi:glucose-6-phosphate 1-dehydrogenase
MDNTHIRMKSADTLVIFGVTGDLAHKMIFPALYAMARHGVPKVPVVGVAALQWSLAQLRQRATDSITQAGRIDDRDALDRLLGDALAGNGALFTREDAVEAAWAVVDPVLERHSQAHRYQPGNWGPKQADALIAADGRWHNPLPAKAMK